MKIIEKLHAIDTIFNTLPYNHILSTILYFIVSLLLIWLSRGIYKAFHQQINIDHQLVEQDNFAFSIAHVGYFIGVLLCTGGSLAGPSKGISIDLLSIVLYGIGGIILLNISKIINNKIVFGNINVRDEVINKENISIALIISANYVAIGLIILGTLQGEGGNVLVTLSIWLIGQILLLLTKLLYDLITPYNNKEQILKGNIAVSIGYAGAIIAIGNLIYFSIQADFIDYYQYGTNILVYTGCGIVLLPLVRMLTDKILLPGRKLTDEIVNQEKPNLGAALLEAFSYIGGSVLISWCL